MIGAGGMGHIGIQCLRAMSATRIVVLDTHEAALALATQWGADETVPVDGNQVARVQEQTRGRGAEAVLDFVDGSGAEKWGVGLLEKKGFDFVISYGGALRVELMHVPQTEISVIGDLVGSYNDNVELMNLAAQGHVKVTTSSYPLDHINTSIDDLNNGRLRGRGIAVPRPEAVPAARSGVASTPSQRSLRTARPWLALVALVLLGACSGPPTRTAAPSRPVPPVPGVLASLGDSITAGFWACGAPVDCPASSWSTGSDARVDSHALRLARLTGTAPRTHNLAISGARAAALPRQATAAVAAGADHVTVLIGANDLCRGDVATMTAIPEFAASVDSALALLASGRPQARVLLLSVPDLGRLHQLGRGREDVRAVWDRLGICPVLLRDAAADGPRDRARRAAAKERLVGYNRALANTCRRFPRCRWDGGAVFRYPFDLSFVSDADFFHPSLAGQRALARVSWQASAWRG